MQRLHKPHTREPGHVVVDGGRAQWFCPWGDHPAYELQDCTLARMDEGFLWLEGLEADEYGALHESVWRIEQLSDKAAQELARYSVAG